MSGTKQFFSRKTIWALGAVLLLVAAAVVSSMPTQAADPSDAQLEQTKSYAKSLSRAFRHTAQSVQPAVVTIEQIPVAVKAEESQESDAKAPQDKNGQFHEFHFRGDGQSLDDMLRNNPLFRDNPELRRFFEEAPEHGFGGNGHSFRGHRGSGSGVIIDPAGIILTNNHVVGGGGKIRVRLDDGREFEAVDVKTDPKTDLAIVRIKADDLKAAPLGDSDKMEIGDWVLALGQPFGLQGTVTAGIISAKGRLGIAERSEYLQTDAAINPGNSGGPLVDLDGNVIGINTAISTRTGGNDGVGFAVPINLAKWVADQLIATGSVQRAQLGVAIQPLTPDLAKQFNVPDKKGVVVAQVLPDSPASKAGLKQGDVIVEFGHEKVTNPRHLQRVVERSAVGTPQTLTVLRDGKEVQLSAVCAKAENQPATIAKRTDDRSSKVAALGLEVGELTGDVANQLDMPGVKGVVITDVEENSAADLAGLERGMVISELARQPVTSPKQFREALSKQKLADGVLLLVRTPQGTRYVVIRAEG